MGSKNIVWLVWRRISEHTDEGKKVDAYDQLIRVFDDEEKAKTLVDYLRDTYPQSFSYYHLAVVD